MEKQIESVVREALSSYRCQYTVDHDDEGSQLVDLLTPDGNDVDSGIRELDLLAEHIAVSIGNENQRLREALEKILSIEKRADRAVGFVDNPYQKAIRAICRVCEGSLKLTGDNKEPKCTP